jgi:hypothetical protein
MYGAKYTYQVHKHGIRTRPHIKRSVYHSHRIDSNHLKSARTNYAHSVTEPEIKIRISPSCKTMSMLELGAEISRTSDLTRTNSDLLFKKTSFEHRPRWHEMSSNSDAQRCRRLALTPFTRVIISIVAAGTLQPFTSPRVNSSPYRPSFLFARKLTPAVLIIPSRICKHAILNG